MSLRTAGDLQQATAAVEGALRTARAANSAALILPILLDAAVIYDQRERYDDAVNAGTEALLLSRSIPLRNFEALALKNLGHVFRHKRDFARAIASWALASDLQFTLGFRDDSLAIRANLAALYLETQQNHPAQMAAQAVVDAQPPAPSGAAELATRVLDFLARDANRPRGVMLWNIWVEDPAAPFLPVAFLAPNRQYRVVVDVSPLGYLQQAGQIRRMSLFDLTEAINGRWAFIDSQPANILLIPADPTAVDPTANLAKLLIRSSGGAKSAFNAAKKRIGVDQDPLATLRAEALANGTYPCHAETLTSLPDFAVSRSCFYISTGMTEGQTFLTFLIWVLGRPIEQTVVPLCVASGRPQDTCASYSPGTIFVAYGTEPLGATPDTGFSVRAGASLSLLSLSGQKVSGVLQHRYMQPNTFEIFTLQKTLPDLQHSLSVATLQAFAEASSAADRLSKGQGLYNILFPNPLNSARRSFEHFLHTSLDSASGSAPASPLATPNKSILIRTMSDSYSPTSIPISLAAVELPTANIIHIGQHFDIITPLPIVRVLPRSDACVSRWVLVLPPESASGDSALQQATARFASERVLWKSLSRGSNELFLMSLRELLDTLNGRNRNLSFADGKATGIIVLSHQNTNRLTLGPDVLTPEEIRPGILFKTAAFAILNGCGTGDPASIDMVTKLNAAGVTSIIATSTEVRGEVAGEFLKCFSKALAAGGGNGTTAQEAFSRTRTCLWSLFDSQALEYSLLGDGTLRLCPFDRSVTTR